MIKIDKNIPIPSSNVIKRKYPYKEMEIGDSFFVNKRHTEFQASLAYFRRTTGNQFKAHKENTGLRIWRVS